MFELVLLHSNQLISRVVNTIINLYSLFTITLDSDSILLLYMNVRIIVKLE